MHHRFDLTEAGRGVRDASFSARRRLDDSLAAARSAIGSTAFVSIDEHAAIAAAEAADRAVAAGSDPGALAGLAVSVKDLFDVAGQITAAGSTVLADAEPAAHDAPAVARLRAAGAAIIGRSHMSEFAFSGVGLNPHFPLVANPATGQIDPTPRIPGGSTSGGAAGIACGSAWAALGSDTGGSIRIPAALQGLVGFKCTARQVPTEGAVPLSPTLDTVCAITRSVRDAIVLHELLADRRVDAALRPIAELRFAVAKTVMTDGLERDVARAFARACSALSAAGARIDEIELTPLCELAPINAAPGFAAAESWRWHERLLAVHGDRYDPRVALRIRRGAAVDDRALRELADARAAWIARMTPLLAPYDAIVSPTVPMVAPEVAPLVASDEAFFAANGRLLRNPSAINYLDGCAISLPCHREGELPVGLMLWHAAMRDDGLLAVALAVEAALVGSWRGAGPASA